jgi:hypothetical protein
LFELKSPLEEETPTTPIFGTPKTRVVEKGCTLQSYESVRVEIRRSFWAVGMTVKKKLGEKSLDVTSHQIAGAPPVT